VEASILRILSAVDMKPHYNERPEPVPSEIASRHLARLGRFLAKLGGQLELAACD
jgi:hypothetical protein